MASSNNAAPVSGGPKSLGTAIERLRHRWGWIVAFGVLGVAMGIAAIILDVTATIASVYTIAVFMVIAGASEIALGISAKTWGRFFLWIISGLLYIVAASFALANPLVAAAVFTLMLGAGLIVTGLARIYFGTQLVAGTRSSVLFGGIVTALVGLLIVIGWPGNTPFILGILLGIDLFFWGLGWISFGFRLRDHS
jgi:uncharacterized membrane protein HdeD (DUF308 family)